MKMLLTKREKALLEALKGKMSVKDGALSIGISPRTAYNMLYRIRSKYRKARNYINTILAYRKSDSYLNYLLSAKTPLWMEIKQAEEMEKAEEVEEF